jgi:hypothetical protein
VLLDVHGDPVPKASVELGMTGMGGLPMWSETRQDTDADGAFEFESVVDGEFRLSSTVDRDGVKQRASESVLVKGTDLENVKLQLAPPFSIQEKFVTEVPEGATPPKLPIVAMTNAELGGGIPPGVPDGTGGFTSPSGIFTRGVPGRLHAGHPVVLPRFHCGQNGRFEIPYVRPGEYYGLAVAPAARGQVSLANLDQNLINQSTRVSVRSNEATDAEIRLVKR